jgi:hypothetical protein
MNGYRIPKLTLAIALGAALFAVASPAFAQFGQCHGNYCYGSNYYYSPSYYGNSQYSYYDSWSYSPQLKCYYCQFHYKPYASYKGYINDYCIYNPSYAGKCYYYSPVSKYYYGCYDYSVKGYCLLGFDDRKSTIAAIPSGAFGKPGALPKISDIAAPANGVAAPAGAIDAPIQAPPGLPIEPANGVIAPPQVSGTDLPTTTPEKTAPMSDPTPLPIGQ